MPPINNTPSGILRSWRRRRTALSSSICRASSSNAGASTSTIPAPPYNVLLLGSDNFSCATLQAVYSAQAGLVQKTVVVVPPSAKVGRHLREVNDHPLRRLAESLGLETITLPPSGLRGWIPPPPFCEPAARNILLTASFGHLIPSSLLQLFNPLSALNVHPSLLPKYRGAAPIQWAIINGDVSTGVSVQELSRGKFDQGRLLGQRTITIPADPDFPSLEPLLAREGAELLCETLENLPAAQALARPQDPALATMAGKITREVAHVQWEKQSLKELDRLQRAISHQYPLWTTLPSHDEPIQVQLSRMVVSPTPAALALLNSAPGTITLDRDSKRLLARCRGSSLEDGVVSLERLKSAGSKWVDGIDWWNGKHKRAGGIFQ